MVTHKFHLVTNSPWPIMVAINAFIVTIAGVLTMHNYLIGFTLLKYSLLLLICLISLWFRDIIREGTFQNHHTHKVELGLRIGMILFIISEVMFFFAFFWAFFHSALAPSHVIACVWPPFGIQVFKAFEIPGFNTCLLLCSGLFITLAHIGLLVDDFETIIMGFTMTLFLAIDFLLIQLYEYFSASFSIADGIYGSTFFMATGFHGFHVLIGTIFIFVNFVRWLFGHIKATDHFGFEAAAWYWHFVDVVWLFLFIFIYYWGNSPINIKPMYVSFLL